MLHAAKIKVHDYKCLPQLKCTRESNSGGLNGYFCCAPVLAHDCLVQFWGDLKKPTPRLGNVFWEPVLDGKVIIEMADFVQN